MYILLAVIGGVVATLSVFAAATNEKAQLLWKLEQAGDGVSYTIKGPDWVARLCGDAYRRRVADVVALTIGSALTESEWKEIARWSGITSLDVAGNDSVDDTCILAINKLPRLAELNVSSTKITGHGVLAMRLPALETLSLMGVPITVEHLDGLKESSRLRVIVLDRTSTVSIQEIMEVLPQIKKNLHPSRAENKRRLVVGSRAMCEWKRAEASDEK
jgi:hypothetical protein